MHRPANPARTISPSASRDSVGGVTGDAADHVGPDPSYGRVTNPERYAVLHRAARSTLDRLTAAYAVERVDGGPGLDADLAGPGADRVWREDPGVSLARPPGGEFCAGTPTQRRADVGLGQSVRHQDGVG